MISLISRFCQGPSLAGLRSRSNSSVERGYRRKGITPSPEIRKISILDDIAPAIFYAALAATAGGAIVLARGAVEGGSAGSRRAGFALVALGLAAILIAVLIYATGPRRVLPF